MKRKLNPLLALIPATWFFLAGLYKWMRPFDVQEQFRGSEESMILSARSFAVSFWVVSIGYFMYALPGFKRKSKSDED